MTRIDLGRGDLPYRLLPGLRVAADPGRPRKRRPADRRAAGLRRRTAPVLRDPMVLVRDDRRGGVRRAPASATAEGIATRPPPLADACPRSRPPTPPSFAGSTPPRTPPTRPVVEIADAPSFLEGEGFKVRRATAGIDLVVGRSVPDARPHGRGRVRAGRGQGRARSSAPRLRDRHVHARRAAAAPRLARRRRRDHRRRHAVDDRGLGRRALRDADAGPARRRRAVPRVPALGEPAVRAEVARPALPGPRGNRPRRSRRRRTPAPSSG